MPISFVVFEKELLQEKRPACILDQIGEIRFCNPAFIKRFQRDLVGTRIEQFFSNCDSPALLKAELRAYQGFAASVHLDCFGDQKKEHIEIHPLSRHLGQHVDGLCLYFTEKTGG